MAFKPRTNIGENVDPSKIRGWLRDVKLTDSSDNKLEPTEKAALFQVIDNLLLNLNQADKSIGELQNIVNNLILTINNITNNITISGSHMMLVMDGQDGMDSFIPGPIGARGLNGLNGIPGIDGINGEDSMIPGPQGIKGDTGMMGPSGFDNESVDEILIVRGDQGI